MVTFKLIKYIKNSASRTEQKKINKKFFKVYLI